jgi:hypothetical protein
MAECVIPKSGYRFSEKITRQQKVRDPEKWVPVFGKDHAQTKSDERDDDSAGPAENPGRTGVAND